MTAGLLSVEGLEAGYGVSAVLQGVALQVAAGEAVAVLGANGAGKSTLMRAIIGLHRPAAGRILFDNQPIEATRANRRARLGIGYCPEGRRVFPGLTVYENLAVACWGNARLRLQRTDMVFALFPALATRQAVRAWTLSGGQQQMLAIGRSLMNAPRLLLLDEPSLGLSPRLMDEVIDFIPALVATGAAVLLAEQNMAQALRVCGRAVVLSGGRVVAAGLSADLAASGAVQVAYLGG